MDAIPHRDPGPRTLLPAVSSLLLALAAAGGCRACPGERGRESVPSDRVFRVAMWDPETLDPSLAADESSTTIARSLFEGLLRPPVGEGAPRPGVAREYEVSADGLTVTFRLRPEARWSDGRPVTAEDFVYAWRRVLDPETGSRSAPLLDVIEGAEAFRRGRASPEGLGVRALDPATLEVRLTVPTPSFPSLLTYPAFAPVRRDVVEAEGRRWTRPGRMVGNGAFRLVETDPKVRVVVERNPSYWNANEVALDRVEFVFLEDERTAWDWYRAGRADWLKGTLTRDLIPEARRLTDAFHADPVLCTSYTVLRVDRPPLDDARVRRALDLAVDKERLVREVLLGGQAPAWSLVPPVIRGPTGYEPPAGERFDPARARAVLSEVEAERGPVAPLTWLYNQGEVHRLVGEFVQAQWRQHLGIEVRLQALEWKMLLDRVRRGDFQMARASWCADVVDPGNFLDVFESRGPSNYPGFADAGYDRLIASARVERDPDARRALLREAEARLLAARPILPLYHYTRLYLLNPRVRGFEPNLLDVHPLEDIRFAPSP